MHNVTFTLGPYEIEVRNINAPTQIMAINQAWFVLDCKPDIMFKSIETDGVKLTSPEPLDFPPINFPSSEN